VIELLDFRFSQARLEICVKAIEFVARPEGLAIRAQRKKMYFAAYPAAVGLGRLVTSIPALLRPH